MIDEVMRAVSGVNLNGAVRNAAGARRLVLLHGVTRRWQSFLPLLPGLSQCWSTCALDLRGHGQSDRTPGCYTVADYVPDVVGYVEQYLESPVVLYGHSLGAMIAAAAACRLAGRVQAIILEDPPMRTMGADIRGNILQSFFSGLKRYAGDLRSAAVISRELADVQLFDPQQQQTLRLGDLRDPVALRFGAASLQQVDPQVFDPIVAGMWLDGLDLQQIFQQVPCPILLLQADQTCGGMLTDTDASLVMDWAADATLLRFPATGHVIHWAQTQQLVTHLHAFLESL